MTTIRVADLNDTADGVAVVSVLDTYAADPIGGGEPLDREVRERLVPALRELPNALVLLAFEADDPVGVAVCFFGFSTFKARPLVNIHDLAVVPERRGHGIGRALLAAVEEVARTRGCCKLTLEVQDGNPRARALYERCGFGDYVIGAEAAPTRFLTKELD